ncbi:unnamed protein product, partial [Prunus brigantina]
FWFLSKGTKRSCPNVCDLKSSCTLLSITHETNQLRSISSYVKINTDGSWKSGSTMAGVGVIIRKIAGSCIGGLAAQVRAQSPLMAEVLALKHGLLRAKELNLVNVVVESDSQVAINSVQRDVSSSNWELYPILKDIRFLKASFTNLNWAWVPREANRSADAVASLARKGMCLESWLVRPPSSLVHILSRDGLPCPPLGA